MTTIAVYTAYQWDHALVLLRVLGPAQMAGLTVLRGTEGTTARPELVSQADLVILQRDFPRNGVAYKQVAEAARTRRVPVVYDLDDLLLELPEDHPDRAIHYYTDALVPMLHAIVSADAVTASTPALCEYLRAYNSRVHLLPNYLNDTLWSMRAARATPIEGPLVVGYMGGDSHLPDLEAIAPVLSGIAGEYGERLLLRFWGGAPPAGLLDLPNVEWTALSLPYPDFAAYCGEQNCDLFIAPLQDNLFNRCKSPVKFMEYSAQGVPGVYSRVVPYESVVIHGENGFLAGSPAEWEVHLRELIESPDLREKLGAQARKTVRAHWRLSAHAGEWVQVYQEILSHGPIDESQASARQVSRRMYALHQEVLAQRIAEEEHLRAQLAEQERSLHDLRSSIAWKAGSRLAPAGSRRERLLRALVRFVR